MAQETQTGALYQPRAVEWSGGRREVQKGEDICIWLIHVEVLQKTTKLCKAIIL